MIITISGPPGSGKTTVGKLLAEKLAIPFLSTGMVFRDMAKEKGVSLAKFGEMALKDYEIDKDLDKRIIAIAQEKKDMVLEGRLAAHMLHLNGIKSFKVWIDAHIHIRAGRISGREGTVSEEVRQEILEREECEQKRYMKIYGIDLGSLSVYDMVINSDDLTPEQIVHEIVKDRESKQDG
ncbi:MAG: AAA family ATPase [Thermoplasmata archaeon]|nr:AAA family ATPase [Thermoplasmata archaeon]